MESVQGEVCR